MKGWQKKKVTNIAHKYLTAWCGGIYCFLYHRQKVLVVRKVLNYRIQDDGIKRAELNIREVRRLALHYCDMIQPASAQPFLQFPNRGRGNISAAIKIAAIS